MFGLKREQEPLKPRSRRVKLRWNVLFKDLSLFASLCMARLMVRGALRRRRQEREDRLKNIKLAPEANHQPVGKLEKH